MSKKLYWHFCRNDKKLGFNDSRHIKLNRTLKVSVEPVLCVQGLHASRRIIDALRYAQGDCICRVFLGGTIVEGNDKVVAHERTVIAWGAATNVLHELACCCAERALRKAYITDSRSWNAIKIKRLWLKGKATKRELIAACYAARSAAESFAWSTARRAAYSAAESDAESTAGNAAWSAAWSAAWNAAGSTVGSTARSAEEKWQNNKLTYMVKQLLLKQ